MQEGTGGCVVDLKGRTIGMSFRLSPCPALLSITTINMCVDMWLEFGYVTFLSLVNDILICIEA